MQRIVIVGGTSAIAVQCARLWLARGPVHLTLVGRDGGRIAAVAQGLQKDFPQSQVGGDVADFLDPEGVQQVADRAVANGYVDIVLIAHGHLPRQQCCQRDLHLTRDVLLINGVSPALFAEAFAGHMQQVGRGTLAVLGSVAGDRGRKTNYVYGAAKGLVTRYLQGLQHRLAASGVRVVLVKPGPTMTPMTRASTLPRWMLAPVQDVAAAIVRGIDAGRPTCYAPGYWRYLTWIGRHLPGWLFNRLDV